ncbi:Nucleoside-diphosphate-sugar epimerase [Indibacter alkaliphilus LW1]|uniref:Nucleoside-diphosphate-sugar epimerase n=1 Tax=Indibacter alkaliphilus (strain CCUG 57479 / KCTC 22604 / LW1) TaxID=1189612 RepID=S2D5D9_INDAL|nr:NAD(P)H-binding protein [Indibacter alkaliphilus]EOZ92285.1 Nucleoside-diphosphate-sugar epimerase [Indibacter alkaliphilus LW1]
MHTISILGLGWLGEPLGEKLQQMGYQVKGSTTNEEKLERLQKKELNPSLLQFCPHPQGERYQGLFETDILFVNLPPRTRRLPDTFHPEQIKFIKEMATQAGVKKLIYVSATSVYPDQNQTAFENDHLDLENTGNKALLNAENILRSGKSFDLTIIRYGGLLGVDRIPGRYFSGKEDVQGDTPVNYIHRDDAVNLAAWIISQALWNEIFNGVAPEHPVRREIYEKNAKDLGFAPPKNYSKEIIPYKVISPEKIIKTGYEFKIPNPLDFWYEKKKQ